MKGQDNVRYRIKRNSNKTENKSIRSIKIYSEPISIKHLEEYNKRKLGR